MLKLSIITVSYNCLNDLKRTIESVLFQGLPPFEYLIIDGGSTDGSFEYLASLEVPYIKWISEKDEGVYHAMNKGIEIAQGDYLLFLNAGDFFVGDVLPSLTVGPCFLPVQTMFRNGKSRRLSLKSFKMGMPNCHQGIVFEAKKIEYNRTYKIGADYDFYLRHGYRDLPMMNLEKAYIFYDNTGMSKKNFIKRDTELAEIILKNFGILSYVKFIAWSKFKNLIRTFYSL